MCRELNCLQGLTLGGHLAAKALCQTNEYDTSSFKAFPGFGRFDIGHEYRLSRSTVQSTLQQPVVPGTKPLLNSSQKEKTAARDPSPISQ